MIGGIKQKKKLCHLPNKIAQCEKNTKRLQEIKEHFEGRLYIGH